MEKLNEYLQSLVSASAHELRLEPNKIPYVMTLNGPADIADAPLLGTQISMMVFPLIPAETKAELPNRPEVQFVLPHNLGKFNFHVQKSPAGFNVTVKRIGAALEASVPTGEPRQPASAPPAFEFESSSIQFETGTSFNGGSSDFTEVEREGKEFMPQIEVPREDNVEVVSANDPQFQTVFSDSSTYEPPGRRDDFSFQTSGFTPPAEEYVPPPPPPAEEAFSIPVDTDPASVPPVLDRRNYKNDRRKVNTIMRDRMDALFRKMAEVGASDLHLSVTMPPMVRKDGRMQRLECNEDVLSPEIMRELLHSIMPEKNRDEFENRNDTDFAYEIEGLARFRCNIFMDRRGMGAVFRIIPSKILTAEQLGLSQAIMNLCTLSKGLVVVTGPTGSGKSTTLCAMVDSINKSREDHIITIEDPIEFVHDNQKCLVNQREVHNHTDSFKNALRAALREDPDIVLVGEMRDLETISIAIETAETGHLVFGTLHTTTAASTVDRIIDQFPADRQQQIRVMLSESLKGVIAQTLLPKKGGGRVAALEVLIVTPAISNLIREGKTFQIPSAMQTGKNHGMVVLNDALFDLVQKGIVEPKDAYIKAVDKANFETMLNRGGYKI